MEEHLQNWQTLSESRKVDVSRKGLKSLKGIGKCKEITWLNISDNEFESLPWLKKLRQLNVLKASNNKIRTIHHLAHLEELKALILNDNNLKSVEGIERLSSLNALVLSHNEIEKIDVSSLAGLSKLSLSHNNLREIPDLKNLVNLKELRLNDNMIETIPGFLALCKRLKLVDLGNNKITSLMRIIDVLSNTKVENLNLKGNEVCMSPDYREKVISSLPTLRILDGQRIKQSEMQPEQASTKQILKDYGSSCSIERKLEKKDEANDSERKGSVVKTKDKTLKTGGFKSRFVTEKGTKEPAESEAKRSRVKKKKHKVGRRKSNCEEMAGDEEISSEITSSKVKVVISGSTQSLQKHAKTDSNINEEKGDVKEQPNKSNKKRKRKRKLSEGDENIVEKKKRRKHSNKKSSDKSQERERKGETGENGRGVSGSLDENDMLKEKLNEDEVLAKRRRQTEGEIARKIKKNNKKDKTKGRTKQSILQDKRSGVLAVEVVKSKVKKKAAERGHVFEKEQTYNFGTGDDVGW